jgi:hypothetical protein
VTACGGMPLALEIAGGHLGRHHSNMQYWQVRPKHKWNASFTVYGCPLLDLAQSVHVQAQPIRRAHINCLQAHVVRMHAVASDTDLDDDYHAASDTTIIARSLHHNAPPQDFLVLLTNGHIKLDKRLDDVVEQSVGDLRPYVLSMFLDAATVMYGCSEAHALCAWGGMHQSESPQAVRWGWAQLQQRSLVKVDEGKLWVHDVVKALAGERARVASPTRVWRPDQVSVFQSQQPAARSWSR